jgi:nucleotide-binding universal stress UspA family protein
MKNILVGTDLTGKSENAVIRAIQLSKLSGAKLHVLHVNRRITIPGNPDASALVRAEVGNRVRNYIEQYAGSSDIEYEAHIESRGRVYERVVEYARKLRADVVVIGRSTRPDVLPDSVFLTTGRVITNSPAPVLVVTQPVSGNYRHILLEAQLSISPEAALAPVRDFGPDIRLTLLIDAEGETQNPAGLIQRVITGFRRRKYEKYLARAGRLLRIRGIAEERLSLVVVEHDYETVLLSKLKDEEIDIVGMVQMRRRLGNRDLGRSVLADLQTASCDLLAKRGTF